MKFSVMFFIVLTFLVASFLFGCGDDNTTSLNPTATPGGQATATFTPAPTGSVTPLPTINVTVEELVTNTTANLHSIWFVDDNVGYAAGADLTVIKTTDGGQTWQDASPTIEEVNNWEKFNGGVSTGQEKQTELDDLYGVAFRNASFGMVAGQHELIMYTTDGGDTWQWSQRVDEFTVRSGTELNFEWLNWYLLGGTDTKGLFTAFNYDPTEGAFCTASGEEWIKGVNTLPVKYNDSAAYGAQLWRVGTQGTLEISTDCGQSWIKQPAIFDDSSVDLNSVHIEGEKGIIAGTGGTLLYSNDIGARWEKLTIPGMSEANFDNAYITQKGTIIAITAKDIHNPRRFIASNDMGSTWKEYPTAGHADHDEEGIFLKDNNDKASLYCVGDNGAAVEISPLDW